ncbi:globin domain-containing protein [Parachitinimonas caeni]|uniref:nitric oxide dioxygenase n=1 Tax=Parachitinimonas caeni TaxID=3031301 RepID=A0ABT7E3B5_9NEIS|nr:globin domain-containing protein [Parachitinimonas caeni]MDK2126534.1 globin domain-containing protein [Parachitinimonas caeni]
MLSATSRPYIDASVPVLREHGVTITRHFYASMFEAHPELKQIFNMGNQANGSQQQSLAAAVFAYAANIDNAAALGPVIERIVHKHASVGITPAHYPIVGRHLLGAIRAVLGDAASPDLMAAWDEAYWLLAGELIAAEARLYQQTGVTAGELRPLKVMEIRHENTQVKSFYLQTPDGQSPGRFLPGQYISVAAQLGDLRQLRQYSLSDHPDQPWWRITVKREDASDSTPAGQVSNCLHTQLQPGDSLLASAAFGDFTPDTTGQQPIALISAGVGITPMISVLNQLVTQRTNQPLLFAHAARNSQHHSLRDDLAAARATLPAMQLAISYEQPLPADRPGTDYHHTGTLPLQDLLAQHGTAGRFYLCGPVGFMQQQWKTLLAAGVSPTQIHREVFGPELLDHLL